MAYYMLSYDASKDDYPEALEDIVALLFERFEVFKIGRPVESTLIFEIDADKHSVATLKKALIGKFPEKFGFSISRVFYRNSVYQASIWSKSDDDLESGFDVILEKLKGDARICAGVENLKELFRD